MIDGLAEESYNDTNQWHYDSQNLWSTVLKDPKLELHAPPHQGVVHENHVCMVFSKKQISEQHWLSLRPRNQSLVGGLIYDFLTYSHKIAGMAGACKLAPNFFCWLIMSPHCSNYPCLKPLLVYYGYFIFAIRDEDIEYD